MPTIMERSISEGETRFGKSRWRQPTAVFRVHKLVALEECPYILAAPPSATVAHVHEKLPSVAKLFPLSRLLQYGEFQTCVVSRLPVHLMEH